MGVEMKYFVILNVLYLFTINMGVSREFMIALRHLLVTSIHSSNSIQFKQAPTRSVRQDPSPANSRLGLNQICVHNTNSFVLCWWVQNIRSTSGDPLQFFLP